jgi:glucosamine--fructose-6-phosphate aminotransferase (isomerizing)
MTPDIPKSLQAAHARKAHPYLMWDGLTQSPDALEACGASDMQLAASTAADLLRARSRLYLVGCGTSLFAGQAAAVALGRIAGRSAQAFNAFELRAFPPPDLAEAGLIAISHSGGTPEVIEAISVARAQGAPVVAISDRSGAPVVDAADSALIGPGGVEPALPKTRSYLTTLDRLYRLTLALADESATQGLADELDAQPERTQQELQAHEEQTRKLGSAFAEVRRIAVAGAGPNLATAKEAALKLTEASLSLAEAWELEEAGHGAWASTEAGDLIIIIATQGPELDKARALVAGMKAIGARTWLITDGDPSPQEPDEVTRLPSGLSDVLAPMTAILPLYQFTYFLTLARGIHPDIMRTDDAAYLAARKLLRPSRV